jgi:hypothetical protein
VNSDIYNWFSKTKYQHKFWLIPQLYLDYLNREIKTRSETLFVDHPADEKRSWQYDILMKFKEGEFPDLEEYTMIEVSIAMADIEFIEYLKSEWEKLVGSVQKTTVKVPVEVKAKDNIQEYQLIVRVPQGFFEQLGQTKESKNPENESAKKAFPEPKLYTRGETAKLMNVSIGTIDNLTKDGILKCHRIKGTAMKRYKQEDIDNALDILEMRLNKRFGK